MTAPRPEALCGLLAEPDRLRVFAAVVLGAGNPTEIAGTTGLSEAAVVAAVGRLTRGGLLGAADGRLAAREELFKTAMRAYAPPPEPAEPLDPDQRKAAVLRAFIVDGRLTQMPAARGKRLVVLEHLAAAFEPGVKYPEREINAVLRAWHDDYAMLRRYLVDEGLLSRENNVYWRSGGWVAV